MKVIYAGRPSRRITPEPSTDGDVLELLASDWDDYGFKTSFQTTCRVDGKLIDLGLIRLLVDGTHNSKHYLDSLRKNGWSGEFPIPGTSYLSVPAEITFYEQLMGVLKSAKSVRLAKLLRDASYLTHTAAEPVAIQLTRSKGFKDSLQRERGSQKAFADGWKVLDSQATSVLDLGFVFEDVCGGSSTLSLKYSADGPLPHDINVLIGPNGVGKSRVLHQIVKDWTSQSKTIGKGFTEKPNLSQVVVVSYSPFESFPVDLEGKRVQDKDAYRYYGLRGRVRQDGLSGPGRVRLSHTFPKRNSASALIECLTDDKRYGAIPGWANKVATVEATLRSAFAFDFAAVQVERTSRVRLLYDESSSDESTHIDIDDGDVRRRFIPIASGRVESLDDEKLRKRCRFEDGVAFFREGKPLLLSSGQRLFAYLVINILGAIRRNSLILVDEPELFLHPTLEIQFVELLKNILARFNSKALLATHSEVIVREMPSRCVHVLERTDDGLIVKHPPFQTFGGDVQRISSYVFGDIGAKKPFEQWIITKINELGSGEELLEHLGDQVNEELVIQIRAMDRPRW